MARSSHFNLGQKAPIAEPDELPGHDAIIVGTGTRYGRMSSQMAHFCDRTGGLWARNALVGKVGNHAATITARLFVRLVMRSCRPRGGARPAG